MKEPVLVVTVASGEASDTITRVVGVARSRGTARQIALRDISTDTNHFLATDRLWPGREQQGYANVRLLIKDNIQDDVLVGMDVYSEYDYVSPIVMSQKPIHNSYWERSYTFHHFMVQP